MKKLLITTLLLALAIFQNASANPDGEPQVEIFDISQTVLKMSLKKGISPQDAVSIMLSKAAELNMKMVGHLPVSDELKARGLNHNHLEVYQFCNPEDAIKMVEFNPIYAAYMPCRIALVQDKKGVYWLLTLNLDMLISKVQLPDDLRTIAITINAQMIEIMTAAATGEF
ncbi:MAG: DUF302 domain-containing protein [Gammaproteobacteria bacterium]|nr:DUF302 domain-containing protein [Gammaproteobacteria bacterium]